MALIAHIGYGYWGKNLARNFAELEMLGAVVDPVQQLAAEASKRFGVPARTFEEVLGDPSIDGVSLASPAELHFAQAKSALEAGKHVYVEKPLALKLDEAEALVRTAQERRLCLMVGHLLQYHPAYEKLRQMVREGALGRLLYVYSNRLSLGKFRREENVLWSFAPHDISMILGLVGEKPSHVTAQGNASWTSGIADMVTMQMHFPGGASGHVQVCWMHPFKEQRLVVIGDKGMAVFEDSQPDWNHKLKLYRHRIETGGRVPAPVKVEAEAVPVPEGEPLKAECRHFGECIDMGCRPRTDGAEGLRVLAALDQAERALQESLTQQGRTEGNKG